MGISRLLTFSRASRLAGNVFADNFAGTGLNFYNHIHNNNVKSNEAGAEIQVAKNSDNNTLAGACLRAHQFVSPWRADNPPGVRGLFVQAILRSTTSPSPTT